MFFVLYDFTSKIAWFLSVVKNRENCVLAWYTKMIFIFSVFGLGTLIFTGLEIAMHATMEKNCVENILIAHPILQALFTFLQMHFLFVNSQVRSHLKHRKKPTFTHCIFSSSKSINLSDFVKGG